ncbi:class F sortase [Nocardia goodfellowii]|uniref:Small lipoprotein YifL n=1 Tax=Nocardia goodfellowii TaxID=882446 RepID=A0ABS4QCP4_9NOCA|nr:class F sortase [Nocardia goodfellowii]MBP2189465.1 putative small lipoprotein YifL [Nocardia goodfellowii]
MRAARLWLVGAAVLCAVAGCGEDSVSLPPPDRAPVPSHIVATAPDGAVIEPAEPTDIEVRSPTGETYLSSPLHPEKLLRGGAGGQQLNPVDELPVWWGESGLPGTETKQTVLVAGHNYAKRAAPFRALRVVRPGDLVVLRTPNGVLEYTVESVGPLPKGSLLSRHELRKAVPGRLILANCDVVDGEPTDDNYFVIAQSTRPTG